MIKLSHCIFNCASVHLDSTTYGMINNCIFNGPAKMLILLDKIDEFNSDTIFESIFYNTNISEASYQLFNLCINTKKISEDIDDVFIVMDLLKIDLSKFSLSWMANEKILGFNQVQRLFDRMKNLKVFS